MKPYNRIVFFVIYVLLVFAGTPMLRAQPPGGPPPAVPVQVTTVESQLVGTQLTLLGDVEAFTEGDIHTEVAGLVEKFPVKEGDLVKKGQVLAKLNSSQLMIELERIREEKEQDRVVYEKEKREYERYQELADAKSISIQEMENQRSEAQSWKFRVRKLEAGIRLLEDRIAKKEIVAPYDGYVVEEYVHVGTWVEIGGKIVKMVRVNPIYVTVSCPQKYLSRIETGAKVRLKLDALGDKVLTGTIAAMIPFGDPASRTFPVKVQLDNPDHRLKPGMLTYAVFLVGDKRRALVVPKDAVVISPDQKKSVYAVKDGKAVPIPVETGLAAGSSIEVKGEGLTEGLKVVTVGNERLRPNQAVKVIDSLRDAVAVSARPQEPKPTN